MLLADLALVFR